MTAIGLLSGWDELRTFRRAVWLTATPIMAEVCDGVRMAGAGAGCAAAWIPQEIRIVKSVGVRIWQ